MRGLEARPQGAGGLPRQLQGRPAVRRAAGEEGSRGGSTRRPRPPSRKVQVIEVNRPDQAPSDAQPAAEHEPTRFMVGGAKGYMTASSYPDDGLGEVFLKMSKQGSTLAGVMDAFSVAISIGLQYGVPLETYMSKFVNMRFESTDDAYGLHGNAFGNVPDRTHVNGANGKSKRHACDGQDCKTAHDSAFRTVVARRSGVLGAKRTISASAKTSLALAATANVRGRFPWITRWPRRPCFAPISTVRAAPAAA